MSKKAINLGAGPILVLVLLAGLVEGGNGTVSPVNKAADLDLSGTILYAINFGNNGKPVVGGVVFSQDQEYSAIRLTAEGEGPATWWGPYPGTGDAALNELLNGLAYRDTPPTEILVDVHGLIVGKSYLLQLIAYEPGNYSRTIDITVDNQQVVTGLNPIAEQGGVVGQGGFVVKCRFTLGNPILNVRIVSRTNAVALSGLILTELPEPIITFADYGSGTTTELVSGKGTWQINWGQGPWTWSHNAGEPLLGSNVSSILALQTTAPAQVSADLVATLPVAGALTLSARDKANANVVIGTMTLSGAGFNIIDLNGARAVVDGGSGMCMGPFHPPGPELTMTLDEATGVFAYIKQTGDWRLELAGLYAMPLIEGMKLQDGILAALGGKVPLIGGLGTFALSGQYEAIESMKPQAFCEYGTGSALKLGAGQAIWDQVWGTAAPGWYKGAVPVNAQFLGENVVGLLETADAGPSAVDEKLIVRFTYGGKITINKFAAANSAEVIGRIVGEMDGICIADLNAERATFDKDGNIVILMNGPTLHSEPDIKIKVVETTGVFADIKQAGTWCLYMAAKVTIARDPTLALQKNIMAGLGDPKLLIGAAEEFVLAGWYYRQAP